MLQSKLQEYKRGYYQKNKERLNKKMMEWNRLHPERRSEISRKYHASHKIQEAMYAKRRAKTATGIYACIKRNGSPVKISKEEFTKWFESQKKICHYCGIPRELLFKFKNFGMGRSRLTIDRIDNLKGYEMENLTLACPRCNHIKSNFFTHDEMIKISKIFINHKWM